MAAVCPACGVAVVPGYVKCPKCPKELPFRARTSTAGLGGTSVQQPAAKFPLGIVAIAIALVAIDVYFTIRDDRPARAETAPPAPPAPPVAGTVVTPSRPPPDVTLPPVAPPTGPNAELVATKLERELKHQRLWSTVQIIGGHVDVRSGSCGDAAMRPAIDGAAADFKAAGLTRVRCLEQSGRLVFERAL